MVPHGLVLSGQVAPEQDKIVVVKRDHELSDVTDGRGHAPLRIPWMGIRLQLQLSIAVVVARGLQKKREKNNLLRGDNDQTSDPRLEAGTRNRTADPVATPVGM